MKFISNQTRNSILFSFILIMGILLIGCFINLDTVHGFIYPQFENEADQWDIVEATRLKDQLTSNTLDTQTRKSLEEKLKIAELSIEERNMVNESIAALGMAIPTPPADKGEKPFQTGVIEGGEDILPPAEAVLINRWQGIVGQEFWQVFAGANGSDSTQGIVIRVITTQDRLSSHFQSIKTPPGSGALKVVSGDDRLLLLKSETGIQYSLDPVSMELSIVVSE